MKNIHTHELAMSLLSALFMCALACSPPHQVRDSKPRGSIDGGVIFQLKSDSTWLIPSTGLLTRVLVVLEITNLESTALRFPVMDKFQVSMESPEGIEVTMEGGQDVLIPGKPISEPVQPGKTFLIDLNGQLGWRDDEQLELLVSDGLGSTWRIGPLMPGEYILKMSYENQPVSDPHTSDIWSGKAQIPPVSIRIVH